MNRRFHFLDLRLLREAARDPEAPPPRRRYRNTQRRIVLRVAIALFAENGFHGTSVDAVARRAGVHKPSVFYHFATKEALYDAAVEAVGAAVLARVFAAVDDTATPARIERALRALVDGLEAEPAAARLLVRDAMDAGVRRGTPHLGLLADALATAFLEGAPGVALAASAAEGQRVLSAINAVLLPFAAGVRVAGGADRRAAALTAGLALLGVDQGRAAPHSDVAPRDPSLDHGQAIGRVSQEIGAAS